MDSQMADPHSHIHEQDRHNVAHAEVDEQHHEKPSVLKKVKAKAKKIKDTLKKHGYGHNHDREHDDGHIPDKHDLDEEDDEDEKIVEDPEVHGAPIYDSAVTKTGGPEGISEAPVLTAERSTAMPHGDPLASKEVSGIKFSDPTKISVPPLEENTWQPKPNSGKATVIREEPQAPVNKPVSSFSHGVYETKESSDPSKTFVSGSGGNLGESKVNLERPKGLEEHPHAPKDVRHQAYSTPSNYQTTVSDPTGAGAEEVGVAPILRSFDRTKIYDDSEPKPQRGLPTQAPTGSHDQFSPEPCLLNPSNTPQNPQKMEESLDTRNRNDTAASDNTDTSNPTSYTEKISYATGVIADKAISAKNAVASKLGYGDRDNTETREQTHAYGSGDGTAKSSSETEYEKEIAATVTEKPTPVYEKVAGAGSTVMSKMHGTGTGNEPENNSPMKGQDKGVSVKDYFSEKLRPGDEDRALSEVISEAPHKQKLDPEKKADDQPRPMGKVTQSEEVTRRLGTGDEKADKEREQTVAGYVNRPEEGEGGNGKGMVEKLKGAVGSLFGLAGGDQSSQTDSSHGGGDQLSQTFQRPSTGSADVGGEEVYSASAGAGGGTGHHSDDKNEGRLQESGK